MRRAHVLLSLFFLLIAPCAYATVVVQNMRVWQAPDHTRLVFDLSGPLQHRLFSLSNPDRIVIDMDDARLRGQLPAVPDNGPYLKDVRSGRPSSRTLRIVLDLKRKVRPRTFVLAPNRVYGHRLVIDLYDAARPETPVVAPAPKHRGQILIAIDPGHGGEDFGAVGPDGIREKDVVLKIGRDLDRLVNANPHLKAMMTRTGDYYISLHQRVVMARRSHADLFVSIHANYFADRSIRGAAVYALSRSGASSAQARILADKENAADLFGGVSIADKDNLLAKVLLDLSMTQTISDSLKFGHDVIGQLSRIGRIHNRRVDQAGFAVLKSPDIPSILVETAFISNPREERLLNSSGYQHKVARAIYDGILGYIAQGNLKKTIVAQRRQPRTYVVKRGDTLIDIARRYNVSVAALRDANDIKGSFLAIGEKLQIPDSDSDG